MNKLLFLLKLSVTDLLFVALLAINVQTAHCDDASSYKIGVILGLTGAASTWSENARMGMELARDEINDAGGVNGHKIELIFEDSKTEAKQSVAAYKKLVNVDKVKIVVGDIWAHLTKALLPLANKDRVILIAPTVADDSEEMQGDYFFTMGHRVSSVHNAVDKFFKINKEVRRVGILCFDNSWGRAYLKMWREVAAENNVEVVDEVCSFGFGDDHRSDITRFRSKKVDAVIAAEWTDQVIRMMNEQKLNAKLLGTSNVTEALKVRNPQSDLMNGTYFTDWRPSNEFIEHFKKKFGKEPMLEADNSYEIFRSIAKALASSDGDMLTAFRKVKYEGVGGLIDFSTGMSANKGIGRLYQVKNRNVVVLN